MPDERPEPGAPGNGVRPESVGRGIAGLATELVRLARESPELLAARVAELTIRQQADLALRLPADQRLQLMLHAPHPMRLVRALPDAELYLTAREIGPDDALPLLALASSSQLHHVVDLESWRKDRFDPERAGAWTALFLEAGEPALRRFLSTSDDELLALLLKKWIRVEGIETDEPAEITGSGFTEEGDEHGMVTPDGHFRFQPVIPEHAPAIRRLLQILFQDEPKRYERALMAAVHELPSDLEEQALRWRQSRLEEHGFPPWEEALSVYAPPVGSRSIPVPLGPIDTDSLTASRSPLREMSDAGFLVPVIDQLPDELRERVLHGIVSVANHVLVADCADTGDPEAHRQALSKVSGYLGIGLAGRGAYDPAATARLLEEQPVIELFREGYGQAVELQQRAESLARSAWAAEFPDWLELLDSPIRERVSGLLSTRPLYLAIDEQNAESRLREFRSTTEVEETAAAVEMAAVSGEILVLRLGLDIPGALRWSERSGQPLRLSALLSTLLAWHATRDELRIDPLPVEVVAGFLRNFVSRRTAGPDAVGRALDAMVKQLATRLSLTARDVSVVAGFGRFCLEELAEQCAMLDPGAPPVPQAVSCLLLAIPD